MTIHHIQNSHSRSGGVAIWGVYSRGWYLVILRVFTIAFYKTSLTQSKIEILPLALKICPCLPIQPHLSSFPLFVPATLVSLLPFDMPNPLLSRVIVFSIFSTSNIWLPIPSAPCHLIKEVAQRVTKHQYISLTRFFFASKCITSLVFTCSVWGHGCEPSKQKCKFRVSKTCLLYGRVLLDLQECLAHSQCWQVWNKFVNKNGLPEEVI